MEEKKETQEWLGKLPKVILARSDRPETYT